MNEISIHGDIGVDFYGEGITAKNIAQQLNGMSGDIHVSINSYGGDAFDGLAIHNLLLGYDKGKVNVSIIGIAASAASVIAVAGDTVEIADNALIMIHDPWMWFAGNAEDFRKSAEELDKIRDGIIVSYQRKSSASRDELASLMRKETWLTSEEAIGLGLATGALGGTSPGLVANFNKPWIFNAPASWEARQAHARKTTAKLENRQREQRDKEQRYSQQLISR